MKGRAMIRCGALPLLAWLIASSACGGGEGDDDGPSSPTGTRPDAAAPVDATVMTACTGEPASCDSFDLDIAPNCEAQTGCVAERECRGNFAFSCFSLPTETQCTAVGCTWTSECVGGGLCFLETNQLDCELETGCFWDSYCDPLSTPSDRYCGQFADETICLEEDACEWGYLTCSGTPAPCSTLDEEACATHTGCSWDP